MPYLTYSVSVGGWGDMANSLTVKLWYHTEKEAEPNAKAEEISRTIGRGGIQLPCDTGTVWLMRGERGASIPHLNQINPSNCGN